MTKKLRLTLKGHWFKQIASGRKKIEYREIKPYWETRLEDGNGNIIVFDTVEFINGYRADAKRMTLECLGITKNTEEGFYEINLGRILDG